MVCMPVSCYLSLTLRRWSSIDGDARSRHFHVGSCAGSIVLVWRDWHARFAPAWSLDRVARGLSLLLSVSHRSAPWKSEGR